MKCDECSFENATDSVYCQECGNKLVREEKRKSEGNRVKHISRDLNDVVFIPKKKTSWGAIIALVFALLGIGFVGLVLLGQGYENETQKTSAVPTPYAESQNTQIFPINQLVLENGKTQYVDEQMYFTGLLKNNHLEPAVDVAIRLDFAWDEAMQKKFDSRYVFIDYVAANGVRTLRELVDVYVPPNRTFWTSYLIEKAD